MINPGCYNGVPIRQVVDWKQSLLRFRWRLHHGRTLGRPLHGRVVSQDEAGSTPNWLANWVSGLAWPSLDTVDEEVTPEFSNFESQCWEPLPRGLRLLPDERGNSCARWKSSGRGLPESFPYEGLKQVDFWDYKMENSQPVEKACGVESFRRLCPLAKF